MFYENQTLTDIDNDNLDAEEIPAEDDSDEDSDPSLVHGINRGDVQPQRNESDEDHVDTDSVPYVGASN